MRLFSSDEEYARCSGDDASAAAGSADSFIAKLLIELETVKADSDAAMEAAEQTRSLMEQKYLAMSSEFSELQSKCGRLQSSLDQRSDELADVQAQKHQLHLQCIAKDGEIERLMEDLSELHKSKMQLTELIIEHKVLELSERNATIDEIESLTDGDSQGEVPLNDIEAESARTEATCSLMSQEKELVEADMSSKLTDVERQLSETSNSLMWNKERVEELETRLTSLQEESCFSQDLAAVNEKLLFDMHKLFKVEKENSEESSRRVKELESVIDALLTHLAEVEDDHKHEVEKEVSARRQIEKEAEDLKVKLGKCEAEIESPAKENRSSLLPDSNFSTERSITSSEFNERELTETSDSLKWKIERAKELEMRLTSLQEITLEDIQGLVELNVQLGSPFCGFSNRINERLTELKDKLDLELKKHTEESAPALVAALRREKEQTQMIEFLHTPAAAMCKRKIRMKERKNIKAILLVQTVLVVIIMLLTLFLAFQVVCAYKWNTVVELRARGISG